MRALIVSDIHSNLEAFESVIADANSQEGFDEIWSLGDLIGYGPDPEACIDLLMGYEHKSVAGNHDLAAIGKLSLEAFNIHAAESNRWTATRLTKDHISYIGELPLKLELDEFTAVHGSPRDPIWEYVISIQAAVASFMHFDTYWCLVGHSHISFLCQPAEDGAVFLEFPLDAPISLGSNRIIVNPGAVGQPRDGDPRASYAIYNSVDETVIHHRAEYDIRTTQKKMEEHGLPKFLIERLALGR